MLCSLVVVVVSLCVVKQNDDLQDSFYCVDSLHKARQVNVFQIETLTAGVKLCLCTLAGHFNVSMWKKV